MTEYEIAELMFSGNQAMHNAFQYWLSITFAVIVTSHLARRQLSRTILVTLALLYFATAAFFFIDYLHWLATMQKIQAPPSLALESPWHGPVKTYLRIGLFVIGTITAECFLIYSYLGKERN